MLRIATSEDLEILQRYSYHFPELEVVTSLAKAYPELLQAIIITDKTENGMALISFWDDIYLSMGEKSDMAELVEYLVFAGRGKRIIGHTKLMETLFPEKCDNFFTNCFSGEFSCTEYPVLQAIEIEEFREVYPLLSLQVSFEEYYTAIKRMERRNASRTYYIRLDGKIVSTAATQIESGGSAIVTSVATDREYRRRGLATALVKSLAGELKRQGKEKIYISYMDESAGKVYQNAGFHPYLIRKTVKLG